jgi:hypothetical protein
MKTDELITALSSDLPPEGPLNRRLLLWLVPAALVCLATVGLWLGFRSDLADAMRGSIFWLKAAYTAALAVAGFWLLDRLGRPGAGARAPLVLLVVILLAALASALFEVSDMSASDRMMAVMGHSSRVCALYIAGLSIAAAPFVFWAARAFAPTRPALAGAAAGLLSAGLAATLYGLRCTEHSAAFVAVWYTLGIAVTATAGTIVGRYCLRW